MIANKGDECNKCRLWEHLHAIVQAPLLTLICNYLGTGATLHIHVCGWFFNSVHQLNDYENTSQLTFLAGNISGDNHHKCQKLYLTRLTLLIVWRKLDAYSFENLYLTENKKYFWLQLLWKMCLRLYFYIIYKRTTYSISIILHHDLL